MKIAVLSGKGGAGKTFVSVNLAYSIGQAAYVDCDVEEPNGRLFLKPSHNCSRTVSQLIPFFDPQKCTGCRECVRNCRFNALIYIKEKPMIFTEVCHSCGLCSLVCKENAIEEKPRPLGQLEIGTRDQLKVITGILNPGEASGIPVIQAAQREAEKDENVIFDCPPGSACSVQESIAEADYCILVAEPTAFGFHNFQMVEELTRLHKKPAGVIIDKMEQPYGPLEDYCQEKDLPILMRIPFQKKLAGLIAEGELAAAHDTELCKAFQKVFAEIGGRLS